MTWRELTIEERVIAALLLLLFGLPFLVGWFVFWILDLEVEIGEWKKEEGTHESAGSEGQAGRSDLR